MTSTIFQLKKPNQLRFIVNVRRTQPQCNETNMLMGVSECLIDIVSNRKAALPYDIVYNHIVDICNSKNADAINQLTSIVNKVLQTLTTLTRQRLTVEPTLVSLRDNYVQFSNTLTLLRNILLPFDRVSKTAPVVQCAYSMFREQIIGGSLQVVINSLTRLINDLRQSSYESSGVVVSIVNMLYDCNCQDAFQKELLASTSDYYSHAVEGMIGGTLEEYIISAKRMLDKEERISATHYPLIKNDTIAFCEKELMLEPLPLLTLQKAKELRVFIAEKKSEMITLFVELCQRVKQESEAQRVLIDAVISIGKECCGEKDDLQMMRRIFDLYMYLSSLKDQCSALQYVIRTGFEKFINAFDQRVAVSLVKYVDRKLKKGQMTPDAAKVVMHIFKYVAGKDVFEQHYQLLLSKRLLYKGYDVGNERMMLEELRRECGTSYTAKLEEMIKDVETGKGWYEPLNASMKSKGHIGEYGLVVINGTSWPSCPLITCASAPADVIAGEDAMRQWYLANHQNRKLDFNPLLSTVLCKCDMFKGVEILMNVMQYELLCLCDGKTVKEVKQAFQGDDDIVDMQIRSLMGKEPLVVCEGGEFKDSAVLRLNTAYIPKKPKIKINSFQAKETPKEAQKVDEKVVKDRQTRIDALVVRTMKKEKKMTYDQLISYVVQHIKVPTEVDEIRKRIDALIEREYMEVDENDKNTLMYLA